MREVWSRAITTVKRARDNFEEFRLLRQEPDHIYMVTIGDEVIDRNNHLHNSRYLDLGEEAAEAMAAEKGISVEEMKERYGLFPIKRAMTGIEWKQQLVEGDLVRVCTNVVGIGNTSIRLQQWVEKDHQLFANLGVVTYVMVNKEGVPSRVPDEVRVKLGTQKKS